MEYVIIAGAVLVVVLLVWLFVGGGASETDRSVIGSASSGRESGAGDLSDEALSKLRNWVIGRSGSVEGKTFHMGQRTITIGRKPTNFIQVADEKVSRVHCQLRVAGPRAKLVDMSSSDGTYLNGEEIEPNEEHLLEDGDEFRVGDVEFEYRVAGDFEKDHAMTDAKVTGDKFETATKLGADGQWRETLERTLEEADGDIQAAADNLGIDPEVLVQLMKQSGIVDE